MGQLNRRQKVFERLNIYINEHIVTTKNSLFKENRAEIRRNANKLEAIKELLEKDLAEIVSEVPQEEKKYMELEQKIRNTLTDVLAMLLTARNYLKMDGTIVNKESFHIDLEPEILTECEEPEKESNTVHTILDRIRNKKKKSGEKLKENAVYETGSATKLPSQEETSHTNHVDIGLAVSTLSSPKNKKHNSNRKPLFEIIEDTSSKDKLKEITIKESRKKMVSQINHKGASTRDIVSYTQANGGRKYTRYNAFIGPAIRTFSKINIQNLITTIIYLYFANYLLSTSRDIPCKVQSPSSHIKIFISNSRHNSKSIHTLKLNCVENKNSKNFKYCYPDKKSNKFSQTQSTNRSKENVAISTSKGIKFKYDQSETAITSNKRSVVLAHLTI